MSARRNLWTAVSAFLRRVAGVPPRLLLGLAYLLLAWPAALWLKAVADPMRAGRGKRRSSWTERREERPTLAWGREQS